MTPTPKLRFVEREIFVPFEDYKDVVQAKTGRILQQWWQTNNTINLGFGGDIPIGETKGEWRDVPIEEEQA
jgi:hypothetical protein